MQSQQKIAAIPRLNIGTTQDGHPFTLALDTATLAAAVFGIRGSGKTSTVVAETEELLDAGHQVVVIDPVNVWWGLRSSADGRAPGYPIPILGGPHGDVELTDEMGAAVADWVVESRSSAIIALRHLRKGRQQRFVQDFLEQLYFRKGDQAHQTSLTLVMDEASQFIPQRVQGDIARLVGAVENCVRQGRSAGIGIVLIDQRPASVNKDVLTQAEVLIAHRVTGPHDRKALKEWTEQHDSDGHQGEFLKKLASLPQGCAWVWIPLEGIFEQVQMRRRRTFDSSRTPKPGEAPPKADVRAQVDVRELRNRLRDALETAEASDPKKLRERIADLEALLEARGTVIAAAPEVDVAAAVETATRDLRRQLDELHERLNVVVVVATGGRVPVSAMTPPAPPAHVEASTRTSPELHDAALSRMSPPDVGRRPAPRPLPDGTELSTPQLKILSALATFRSAGIGRVAKHVVAVFADQSPRSSGYQNNLSRLRTLGFIDYGPPAYAFLTPEGERIAPAPERVATLKALHERWIGMLPRPQGAIVRELVAMPAGRSMARDDMARRVGASPISSGYQNNISALRSLGLLDYPEPGRVAPTELLFPKGLR